MGIDFRKLLAVVAAVAAGVFLWHSPVVYPLKLLTVLLHEAGHAIAANLVGGRVVSITIDRLEGGLCLFEYQPTFLNKVVTSSAGYLGSALAGAILLFVTMRRGSGKLVLGALAAFLAFVTVVWARSLFTVAVAAGMTLALGLCARYLSRGVSQLLAFFIAVFVGLYAVFDLRDDLWSASRRGGTDAAMLAQATYIPSIVWAVLWSLVAIGLLAGALYFGARGRRRTAPVLATARARR